MALDALRYASALIRLSLGTFVRQAMTEPTLADVLARRARQEPQALALEVGELKLSYRQLEQQAEAAAATLTSLGLREGDVAAIVGRNSVAYVAALLGAARAGITLALVHPELGGEPLRQALSSAGARVVLCEEQQLPALRAVGLGVALHGFVPDSAAPFVSAHPSVPWCESRKERDFALVFTSGTTGAPKACRLPHSRVIAAACLFGVPLFDFRAGDKLLCALPLHHGSPLMLGLACCLVTGTPLVLERQFSARDFMRRAIETRATALLYVGDLGRMLLAAPGSEHDRAHRLRLAVGNGMAPEVWPAFQERFGIAQVREFYAATESPVGILNLAGRVGSVGNLPYAWMFGLKLVKVDGEGELVRGPDGFLVECGDDEPGELLVRAGKRGVGVYHGYVDPSATEARLVRDAFKAGDALFRTFDVLRRDRDGFYYFVERGGDGYRFRGENVAVASVERELLATPGVSEALAVGVQVPGYDGRAGLAVLVTEPGFDVDALNQLQTRLARSAVPRFVRVVPELARTSSLKLMRRHWSLQGIDPARVSGTWVWLDGRYTPLDAATYRDIVDGRARL